MGDEEEMQDSLVMEEGMMVNFPLIPSPLVSFLCRSCFKVLSGKKKLNNHIVEMHKVPTSCRVWYIFFFISLSSTALCTYHPHIPARPVEIPLKRESLPTRH